MTVQMPERPVLQGHVDLMRRCARILGGKALLDMMIINVHRGMHRRTLQLGNARSAAPRQKVRVFLHAIHEIEHLFRAVRNQHCFFY